MEAIGTVKAGALHRGDIYQFFVQWIHYSIFCELTGRKTGKITDVVMKSRIKALEQNLQLLLVSSRSIFILLKKKEIKKFQVASMQGY